MDRASIAAYWGDENLTKWSEGVLRAISIPNDCKAFLIEVGLPSSGRDIAGWDLEWTKTFPDDPDKSSLVVLATYANEPLFSIEKATGHVVTNGFVGHNGMVPERFVNLSVERFAAALTEWDRFIELERLEKWPVGADEDWKLIQSHISRFEATLVAADPEGMENSSGYWWDKITNMQSMW